MNFDPRQWPTPLAEKDLVAFFVREGDPVAKGRPRLGKHGHVYTPTATRAYEEELAWLIRAQVAGLPDATSRFGLRATFYRSNRQRIDCDNLLKAAQDAVTLSQRVWADDSQCFEVCGRIILLAERPRVEIAIYLVEDPTPKASCKQCGGEFVTYKSVGKEFCTRACYRASCRVDLVCKHCGRLFVLLTSSAKRRRGFCSRQCFKDSSQGKPCPEAA